MSSYDNRYNDIDDEPDFDYVNDDYGFDMDDDKELSARTSTGASKNHKKKKASKPVTIWSEIFSYIKILAAAVIIAFVFTQYIIVNAEVPTGSMKNTIMEHDRLIGFKSYDKSGIDCKAT